MKYETPNYPKWIKAKKMEKKFNLSERSWIDELGGINFTIDEIKEFIKKLKQKIKGDSHWKWTFQEIDKLAGDKLI